MFDCRKIPLAEVPAAIAGRVMMWFGEDGKLYKRTTEGTGEMFPVVAVAPALPSAMVSGVVVSGDVGDVEVLRLDVASPLANGVVVEGWAVLVTAVADDAVGLPVELWLQVNGVDLYAMASGLASVSASPFINADARPLSFRVVIESGALSFVESTMEVGQGAAAGLAATGGYGFSVTWVSPSVGAAVESVAIVARKTAPLGASESVTVRSATIKAR